MCQELLLFLDFVYSIVNVSQMRSQMSTKKFSAIAELHWYSTVVSNLPFNIFIIGHFGDDLSRQSLDWCKTWVK